MRQKELIEKGKWFWSGKKHHFQVTFVIKVVVAPADLKFELWFNGEKYSRNHDPISIQWNKEGAETRPDEVSVPHTVPELFGTMTIQDKRQPEVLLQRPIVPSYPETPDSYVQNKPDKPVQELSGGSLKRKPISPKGRSSTLISNPSISEIDSGYGPSAGSPATASSTISTPALPESYPYKPQTQLMAAEMAVPHNSYEMPTQTFEPQYLPYKPVAIDGRVPSPYTSPQHGQGQVHVQPVEVSSWTQPNIREHSEWEARGAPVYELH